MQLRSGWEYFLSSLKSSIMSKLDVEVSALRWYRVTTTNKSLREAWDYATTTMQLVNGSPIGMTYTNFNRVC